MRRATRVIASALAGLAALLVARPAVADDLAAYFPLQVGRVWTYNLRITTPDQEKNIEYSTRVVRQEALADVGGAACYVLENTSGERVLETNWFHWDAAGRLLQARRQSTGRNAVALCAREGDTIGAVGRVLVDPAALGALPKETGWDWGTKDNALRGSVRLVGRVKLRLRNFPEFDCLQLVDTATSTAGDRTATIERRVWMAAGYGMVQEQTTIVAGEARTQSEATLIRYETP
jgi:hypothetical protein